MISWNEQIYTMRNIQSGKYQWLAVITFLFIFFLSCSSCNSDSNNLPPYFTSLNPKKVPSMLFGANLSWEHLGDGAMSQSDLLFDRSFRAKADVTMSNPWQEYANGGTITWNTTDDGDTNPAGGNYYTGYVAFSRSTDGYTGILQQTKEGILKDTACQINFSSYGEGGTPAIYIALYNSSYSVIGSDSTNAQNSTWTQHQLFITPSEDASVCYFGIYIQNAGTVRIDEIRMAQKDTQPTVKSEYKTRIQELGVKALRWPGGTLADWFSWKDAVGPRLSRGELRAFDHFETPALGLHEFLNLCEELGVEPLITINIFAGASDAADIVEYILGDATTPQGALRSTNGRSAPWNVQYFEIGNEPAESYKGSDQTENAGANYAVVAQTIIAAMKAKASSLGKTIYVSGIAEPNFQLADWLTLDVLIVKLLFNWNNQVFDTTSGIIHTIDMVHGHYYAYREYDADEETRFIHLMSGGSMLSRIVDEKLLPVIGNLPLWITEYHVLIESGGTIHPEYTLDFQSGLSIADLILSMMNARISGAFIWNLSQYGMFGMTGTSGNWLIKPSGLVFQMLSAAAGEEIITCECSDNEFYTITNGTGIIPSGQSYPFVTVFATKNALSGKPRIFALNRDYDSARTVSITAEGLGPGEGTLLRFYNASLSAHNEGTEPQVEIQNESIIIDNPLVITLAPHSFVRIDVN